jgi:hypothetical protein
LTHGEDSVQRYFATALVALPLLLGGCNGLLPTGAKAAEVQRVPGTWKQTQISVLKYKNALFRDTKTGDVIDPEDAKDKPVADVSLESGDFEELRYGNGRLRYALFPRLTAAQPYVVERVVDEPEFDELDKALYADKFFGLPEKNWATVRLPLFVVQYDQNGKGSKASFTPNLNRLLKFGALVNTHFELFSGETRLPAGVKQTAYYMTSDAGKLKVSVSTQTGVANSEAEDKPWKLKSASYDAGKGMQAATVDADGATLSLPLPSGGGAIQLMSLKLTAEGEPGTWETLIPVRTAK